MLWFKMLSLDSHSTYLLGQSQELNVVLALPLEAAELLVVFPHAEVKLFAEARHDFAAQHITGLQSGRGHKKRSTISI